MDNVKNTNAWDEEQVVSTVKSILNHYMGVPPESFEWKGIHYTPKEFLTSCLKLKMEDYDITIKFRSGSAVKSLS